MSVRGLASCAYDFGNGTPVASCANSLSHDERGAVLVEFAMVFPILLSLSVGLFEFGIALQNEIVLTDAVHQGAQTLSGGRTDANIYADALARVTAAAGPLTTNLGVTFSICNAAGTSCASCAASGASSCATMMQSSGGDAAMVNATYPCDLNYGPFGFGSACTLSVTESVLIQ